MFHVSLYDVFASVTTIYYVLVKCYAVVCIKTVAQSSKDDLLRHIISRHYKSFNKNKVFLFHGRVSC